MGRNPPFYCFICDKTVEGSQTSYNHFEYHIWHTPFSCLDCKFKCHTKSQLKEHLEKSSHLNYQKKTKLGLRKFIDSLESFSNKLENIGEKDIVKIDLVINNDEENYSRQVEVVKQESVLEEGTFNISNECVIEEVRNENIRHDSSATLTTPDLIPNIPVHSTDDCVSKDKSSKGKDKLIRIKNSGYLDITMLQSKTFSLRYKISDLCKVCRKDYSTPHKKIKHVFQKHLKLSDCCLLKCGYCLRKGSKNRKYLDFSAVKEHYRGSIMTHGKVEFQNNLEYSYKGNKEFVHFDGNQEILHDYEKEFERCFVRK
uniref:C2H2-type domain-containing protein n=1 Tax=Strongyloides papillosus TaxID=174720 RepID=A0A0N5CAU2_STREA